MSAVSPLLKDIPTNIITGFLGVGKTTAILQLLRSKPASERWAVLINEFGEIGVDASLLHGRHEEDQDVFVTEVPGGCMCCAAGLPMQVALNRLLTHAKPDRLLIEPTGLGHPKEVLRVLTRSASYRTALSIQRTITLVNACHLDDSRYTDNETFNQQIEVADVVIANKADLLEPGHSEKLRNYVQQHNRFNALVLFAINGEFDNAVLSGPTQYAEPNAGVDSSDHHDHAPDLTPNTLPECGYIKKQNTGDGYCSVGWRFREDKTFTRNDLFSFLSGIEADRVKAVMNTENGVYGYNIADGSMTEIQLFGRGQSCIEIIDEAINDTWEQQLLDCLSDTGSN